MRKNESMNEEVRFELIDAVKKIAFAVGRGKFMTGVETANVLGIEHKMPEAEAEVYRGLMHMGFAYVLNNLNADDPGAIDEIIDMVKSMPPHEGEG